MENLTLPEPAASLWAAKRSIVHAIPPEMFGRNIPPHLGGGTILAARWKHRISTDIDVLFPGRNTLIDLVQDNDRNIVSQLGGLSIRKTIAAGPLAPERYAARGAGRALVQSGVATHLNNNGPVTAPQVLAAIRTAVNDGSERTILDSTSRSSIDMINRLGQLDPRRPKPTVRGQAQARSRGSDHGYDR